LAKPTPEKVDAGAPAPVAPAADGKCVPGTAARLRLRPSEARIAPGERVCFVVKAVDDSGCELSNAAIDLSLQHPPAVQGSLSGSCFKAAESAALAEGVFKVQAASGSLRAEATVVVSTPDLSDITARRTGSGASSLGTSERTAETQYETGVRAVTKSSRDPLLVALGVALLGCVIGLAASIALRRARKPGARRSRPRSSFPEPRLSDAINLAKPADAGVAEQTPPDVVASGPQRICPRCRRGYPPGSERCAADGEALLDYEDFVAVSAAKSAPRFCPECGQALVEGALFCGACGHKLTVQ
jgi:zinc-ribbon domain